mgnify:CR=1 FL=1
MPKFDFKKILISLGVLVILGAAFYFLYQTNPALFMSKEAERAWRSNQEQQIAALITAGDFDACANVGYKSSDGVDYKIVCQKNIALNKAIATLDFSWCNKVANNTSFIESCEEKVVFAKLAAKKNLSVCDSVTNASLKNECVVAYWFQKVIEEGKVSICKNLEEPFLKICQNNFWLSRLVENPVSVSCSVFSDSSINSDCEIFKSSQKEQNLATKLKMCLRISSPELYINCKNF